MQLTGTGLSLSATDLGNFLGCTHASFLDFRQLSEPVEVPGPDEGIALIRAKGIEHERAYLATLKARDLKVVEITEDGLSLADRVGLTREAMRSGAEVIYQGALVAPPWLGFADFLQRVGEPSDLGAWSYGAVDTKLACRAKPEHLIQLSTYARLVGNEQGRLPKNVHVVLGNQTQVSFRVSDFIHYASIAQTRLEAFVARPTTDTVAEPCGHCAVCRWQQHCVDEWEATDHLSLVARIARNQRDRLCEVGVITVQALSTLPQGSRVPRLQAETVDRLRSQAALQVAKRGTGENRVEVLPLLAGKGFARLPQPNGGDCFLDLEGDPFEPEGLEYLFGLVRMEKGKPQFTAFWGHDREAEKRAFEEIMDRITARLERYPAAHVYHYAAYEETAFKRLAMVHGTRETQLDDLLRHRKFVDLYKVVREAVRISEPSYSLKNVELFYDSGRGGEVTTAMESVVVYERWRETGDAALLDQIAAYNDTDCRSLLGCRNWLLSLRPPHAEWFTGPTEADSRSLDPEREAKRREQETRFAGLMSALLEGVPEPDKPWRELAGQLVHFHQREAKPEWWAMFHRQEMTEEELIDDAECIGALRADTGRAPHPVKNSLVYSFRFPPQDFKFDLHDTPLIAETLESAGEIVRLDEDTCELSLRRAKNKGPLPSALSLIPTGPVGTEPLRDAIARYVRAIVGGDQDHYSAVTSILRRGLPAFTGPAVLGNALDEVGRAVDAIGRLDRSVLVVQGPPGAGKTFTASNAIVEMLARGYRVGVSSHSHKAINNLLEGVEKAAIDRAVHFSGVKKSSYPEHTFTGQFIEDTTINEYATGGGHNLIAGTAWLFARSELDQQIDYLFVDEAGQVSLANTIAMGVSARNIVLIGDQMQLSQPIQGTHPGRSGLSALEHILDGAETVPPERGIFLSRTRRMHPDLCRFLSDAFYDGRLLPEPGNERQSLLFDGTSDPVLVPTGLRFVDVEHKGCSQKSEAEADRVCELYQSLLRQHWTDREGKVHRIGTDDILVVAPYNMQVNLLRNRLPAGARAGTVDRFQGQEATVVLVSMTTSSGDDLSRHIEFLFSRNRLNVAVSRAHCLSVILASSRLLEVSCSTVKQMRLVNALCWAKTYSD